MALISQAPSSLADSESKGISGVDFWLLWIRFLAGVSMIYYQSWDQAVKAWGFVWEQKEWDIAQHFESLGMPQPSIFAVALAFLLLVCPFGLVIGFLTRINGIITFAVLLFVLFVRLDELLSTTLNPQSLVLYIGMALLLGVAGPGALSFDALLTRRRHRKRKEKNRAL